MRSVRSISIDLSFGRVVDTEFWNAAFGFYLLEELLIQNLGAHHFNLLEEFLIKNLGTQHLAFYLNRFIFWRRSRYRIAIAGLSSCCIIFETTTLKMLVWVDNVLQCLQLKQIYFAVLTNIFYILNRCHLKAAWGVKTFWQRASVSAEAVCKECRKIFAQNIASVWCGW